MITTIEVNGKVKHVDVEPRQTLADWLRDACDLTATHLGCEHGACGACTVSLDGKATRSCLILAVMCDGRSVETLEGLQNDPCMEILKRNFHHHYALQCGFCTPGMLLMGRDIALRHNVADTKTIRHELSGQICRCTGFFGIVNAIEATVKEFNKDRENTSFASSNPNRASARNVGD
jgi:carbon-monoxide dehydrogenase small subunit